MCRLLNAYSYKLGFNQKFLVCVCVHMHTDKDGQYAAKHNNCFACMADEQVKINEKTCATRCGKQ